MEISWNGPDPKDRVACPYPVDFASKPAPAETLNSLESGRLFLQVYLGDGVRQVSAKLINNAKKENLEKMQSSSTLMRKTFLTALLTQDNRRPCMWTGELNIPSSWMEGGTRTYERTGAASPKSKRNLYTLEITYVLEGGNSCTAYFNSEDAFHWQARAEPKM